MSERPLGFQPHDLARDPVDRDDQSVVVDPDVGVVDTESVFEADQFRGGAEEQFGAEADFGVRVGLVGLGHGSVSAGGLVALSGPRARSEDDLEWVREAFDGVWLRSGLGGGSNSRSALKFERPWSCVGCRVSSERVQAFARRGSGTGGSLRVVTSWQAPAVGFDGLRLCRRCWWRRRVREIS